MRGFVPPSDFIPLAEESGLIVEMGEWILRQACREAASWPMPLQIAVNLSPAQFMHGDVVGLVHSILLETGLAPGRLELEITEGVLIEDFDRGLALLRRLKALGVRVSMDDFGSGYSSLSYLQAFPFDKIKIDRAFVMNLGRNPQSASIVRAVIGLGHGLGMSIVAEGVETQEQLSFLAEEGCDAVQGYFIGKPAPIGQYFALVGRADAMARARAQDRLAAFVPTVFSGAKRYPRHSKTLYLADGGLRSCDHRRRFERRQRGARRRGPGLAGDSARAGRPRRRRILGDVAPDPWRSGGAGAPGLFPGPRGAGRARHLAADRAASGAPDALCDPRPFRRASALAAAVVAAALRPAGPRLRLPASVTVDVTHHPVGNALKRPFGTAFEYSDCVVDDSRLVVANAVDAAERGAEIRTGARCVRADRLDVWRLAVIDRGHRRVITARALANASGAWTASVAETVLRMPPPELGTAMMGQIIVRRLFDTDNVYVFQNSDRRLIFASPYERDFTLIGTVGQRLQGRSRPSCRWPAGDVAYLCDAANRYFREQLDPSDVIRTVSGANAVIEPAGQARGARRRDDVRSAARQGAAADDLRRRHHDRRGCARSGRSPG